MKRPPWFARRLWNETRAIIDRGEGHHYRVFMSRWYLFLIKNLWKNKGLPETPEAKGLIIHPPSETIPVTIKKGWYGTYYFQKMK